MFLWIFVLGISFRAYARVHHWPEICAHGEIRIQNVSNQELHFVLQEFEPFLEKETQLQVAARSQARFAVHGHSDLRPLRRLALMDFVSSSALPSMDPRITFECLNQSLKASNYQSGNWTFLKKADLQTHKIWLKNLAPSTSEYLIETFNASNVKISSNVFTAAAFEQKSFHIKNPESWTRFVVSTKDKMAFWYLNQLQTVEPIKHTSSVEINFDDPSAYFELVSNQDEADTMIVKIENPTLIAKARELISLPRHEKILIGDIELGSGGFNFNRASGKSHPWSWHVSRVTSFSDFASTACNGLPQFVEDRVRSWVKDPGRICFWTYRIKREIRAN